MTVFLLLPFYCYKILLFINLFFLSLTGHCPGGDYDNEDQRLVEYFGTLGQ